MYILQQFWMDTEAMDSGQSHKFVRSHEFAVLQLATFQSQWTTSIRQNCAVCIHSSQGWLSSHYYGQVTRDGSTLFTQSCWSSNSSCITTARDEKSLHKQSSIIISGKSKELHENGIQFLTQYKKDENDLLKQTITSSESWIHFYKLEKKISEHDLEKKEEGKLRKFKNEQSARQVILITFWDCLRLVYMNLVLMPVEKSEMSS